MRNHGTVAVALALALSLVFGTAAAAAGPDGRTLAVQGNGRGAVACATCHGENGVGLAGANFVRLAGLNPAYIAKQLHDFKQGGRDNPIMKPIAAALSDEEMAAVARYYASQPRPRQAAEKAADADALSRGEKLARRGLWDKNVPACFQCHGPDGRGVPPHFPAIAGQPSAYVVQQFQAWRSGQRNNDPVGLMKAVAERLSDDDVRAVAAYLASQAGAPIPDTHRSARR